MLHLLDLFKNVYAGYRFTYPFPYFVIFNALPQDEYDYVRMNYPTIEQITSQPEKTIRNIHGATYSSKFPPPGERLDIEPHHLDYPHPFSYCFEETKNKFYTTSMEIFGKEYNPKRLKIQFNYGINTPNPDYPHLVKGPHIDSSDQIFTCFYYIRYPGDESTGGDLLLYRKIKDTPQVGIRGYPSEGVDPVAIIPASLGNVLLGIYTWKTEAIHGTTTRTPSDKPRQLITIVAKEEANV